MDCLRLVIQSIIGCEQALWGRAVQAAQPFLAVDPTGAMGLLAGLQVLERAARRPV